MGEVYKAYDDRLDRWVAIKRIRSDKETAEEHRERFQREARATARLNHSSIVHVYDIFHDGDSNCIVMEYVEGRTLDKLVLDGSLTPLKVAKLGEEISAGLTEAHAKGILHRDLKVENIIMTPEGHAKILDFGLAKPILSGDLDDSLTGKGQLVGTSRAMAPEYVSGEEVDHRSDLFSLGVLLYEASTGHSPFKSHNTLATLKQVMLYRQTPAHQLNSHVPPEMSDLIDRLLAKDPGKRPHSADEVAQEFRLIVDQLSSETVPRPPTSAVLKTDSSFLTPTATATSLDLLIPRRRWWVLAAVLVAVLGSAFLLSQLSPGVPEGSQGAEMEGARTPAGDDDFSFQARDQIVLGDLENRTGDPVLDDSVSFAFRVGLEQSRFAQVLPDPQIRTVLQRMQRDPNSEVDRDLGIEICRREGAKALVSGSIVRFGDSYTLTGTIVDPGTGASTFSTTAQAADQNAIIPAIETVTQAIRNNLGESLAAIEETRALEKVTTANLEALKAYTLGERQMGRGNDAAGVQLFEQAIRIDPEFAMAHAKLGAYHVYDDRAKALKHLETAHELSDRLTESEKLYVEGWVARMKGSTEEEFRKWQLLSQMYPNDYTGHHNVAMFRWRFQYRFEEAVRSFKEAERVAAPENQIQIHMRLAYCLLALGNAAEALENLEKIPDLRENILDLDPLFFQALVDVYLFSESYPEAEALIAEAVDNSSPALLQIEGRMKLAQLHVDRGSFERSLLAGQEALRLAEKVGEEGYDQVLHSWLHVLAVLEQIGAPEDLAAALAQAADAARKVWDPAPGGDPDLDVMLPLAMLGKLLARNSSSEEAAAFLAKLRPAIESNAVSRAFAKFLEGEIALSQGKANEAVRQLQTSLAEAETFQAHESLARAYDALGRTDAAIGQFRWLRDNRGRAFVECSQGRCQFSNVLDWGLASYQLGRLYERSAQIPEARAAYGDFLDRWPEGSDLPLRKLAQDRLRALGDGDAPPAED